MTEYAHEVVAVYGPGASHGFLYTAGLHTEFFCIDVPYENARDVAGMMNFLSERNVTNGQRCHRFSDQRFFTHLVDPSAHDEIRTHMCTASTGSRFIELVPYVVVDGRFPIIGGPDAWVPDPDGVGAGARAPDDLGS